MIKRLLWVVTLAGVCGICGVGAGAQTSWQYTALGDSLGTGYLAQQGYVPRFHGYLQSDNAMSVVLASLSQNGWSSGNLLNALRTNATFQTAVSNASVLTWDIGTNDLKTPGRSTRRASAAAATTRTACGALSRRSAPTGIGS